YFELSEELAAGEAILAADEGLLGTLVEEIVPEEGEADRTAVDERDVVADTSVEQGVCGQRRRCEAREVGANEEPVRRRVVTALPRCLDRRADVVERPRIGADVD